MAVRTGLLNISNRFKRGANLVETGALVGLIAAVAIVAITGVGQQVDGIFTTTADSLPLAAASGQQAQSASSGELINTSAPAVSGTGEIGQVLTASTGGWSGSTVTNYDFQWMRDDGPISGATSNSYTTTGADGGRTLSVAVTAYSDSGSETVTSSGFSVASGNEIWQLNEAWYTVSPAEACGGCANNDPTLGSCTVGGDVYTSVGIRKCYDFANTSSPGSWYTAGHFWSPQCDTTRGAVFCHAENRNPCGGDRGESDRDCEDNGSAAAPVNTHAPNIVGDGVVGLTLTAANGGWTGSPDPSYSHQWLRNGSNISGATGNTYTLVGDDANTTVSLRVTATNSEGSASATSGGLSVTAAPGPEQVWQLNEAWYSVPPATACGGCANNDPTPGSCSVGDKVYTSVGIRNCYYFANNTWPGNWYTAGHFWAPECNTSIGPVYCHATVRDPCGGDRGESDQECF
ncbi:MAG: hypothetical protein Alpg2KO_09880 [Alphaproteobacteria bacterium]